MEERRFSTDLILSELSTATGAATDGRSTVAKIGDGENRSRRAEDLKRQGPEPCLKSARERRWKKNEKKKERLDFDDGGVSGWRTLLEPGDRRNSVEE